MHVEFKRTLRFSVGSYQIVIHLENYKQANLNNPCQQSSVTNERKGIWWEYSLSLQHMDKEACMFM